MICTKFSRRNPGLKWARTSSFMVPNVESGRCFIPSLKATRMLFLNSGRGNASTTACRCVRSISSRCRPRTSVSTPAVTKAISGDSAVGIAGVVWRAIASQYHQRALHRVTDVFRETDPVRVRIDVPTPSPVTGRRARLVSLKFRDVSAVQAQRRPRRLVSAPREFL